MCDVRRGGGVLDEIGGIQGPRRATVELPNSRSTSSARRLARPALDRLLDEADDRRVAFRERLLVGEPGLRLSRRETHQGEQE